MATEMKAKMCARKPGELGRERSLDADFICQIKLVSTKQTRVKLQVLFKGNCLDNLAVVHVHSC